MASIVESSDDGIIGQALDGTIVSWNRGAENPFGCSLQEIEGQPISVLVPPDRHNELPQILGKIRQGEYINNYETMYVKKDGRHIHVSITESANATAQAGVLLDFLSLICTITLEFAFAYSFHHTFKRKRI
jgi:PAS domain S-box-containing protein